MATIINCTMRNLLLLVSVKLFLLSLIVCLVLANEQKRSQDKSTTSAAEAGIAEEPTRKRFKLRKLLDFTTFKSLFKKRYNSVVEELTRSRLFQGRAIRAFISSIRYIHYTSSSFLAINQFSDWTKDELDQLYLDKPAMPLGESTEEFKSPITSSSREGFEEPSKLHERNLLLKDLLRVPEVDDFMLETPLFEDKEPVTSKKSKSGSKSGSIKNMAKRLVSKRIKSPSKGKSEPTELMNSTPTGEIIFDIDHRNCLLPVRDQQRCKSCYAIASIAHMEWAYCSATGKKIAFSEQYILDCGFLVDELEGCRGGVSTQVGVFVKRYGLELLDIYPYVAGVNVCPYDRRVSPEAMGYIRIEDPTYWPIPSTQFRTYLKKHPLIVNVIHDGRLSEFGGGIDKGAHCKDGNKFHAMLLVGMGYQDGINFYLLQNSFSSLWGEFGGYYRLDTRSNCFQPSWGYAIRGSFNKEAQKNVNKKNDPGTIKRKFARDSRKADRIKELRSCEGAKIQKFSLFM